MKKSKEYTPISGHVIVLENIRSAYNTGNIIRTADALGRNVVLSGFTPTAQENTKVSKTSLGAQDHISIEHFWNTKEALEQLRSRDYLLIAVEITDDAIALDKIEQEIPGVKEKKLALIMGNENTGVLEETLAYVEYKVMIPMQGFKESMNVGQAAAICMREFGNIRSR